MRTLADRQREQSRADADDRDLTSRSDRRRAQDDRETALKELARRLVGLKEHQLLGLKLEELLLDAVHTARAIRSANARNRQIAVVRQHLRDLGPRVVEIENALAGGGAGPATLASQTASDALRARTSSWVERLVMDGDAALDELCEAHPAASRQELRQQVRALAKARSGADLSVLARAERRLRLSLEAVL